MAKSEISSKDLITRKTVFISYAWTDEIVISAIEAWLRNKSLITKIDKRDFFTGSRIRDEIVRLMSLSDVILIFYTRKSKNKPWLEFERELAFDLEMEAKIKKKRAPQIIYINMDNTELPNISIKNRIRIMAEGKSFSHVCEEIYASVLELPRKIKRVDLSKFESFIFGEKEKRERIEKEKEERIKKINEYRERRNNEIKSERIKKHDEHDMEEEKNNEEKEISEEI